MPIRSLWSAMERGSQSSSPGRKSLGFSRKKVGSYSHTCILLTISILRSTLNLAISLSFPLGRDGCGAKSTDFFAAITMLTRTMSRCLQWRTTTTQRKFITSQGTDNSISSRICIYSFLVSQEEIRMQVLKWGTCTMECPYQIANIKSSNGRKQISKLAFQSTTLWWSMLQLTPRTS